MNVDYELALGWERAVWRLGGWAPR